MGTSIWLTTDGKNFLLNAAGVPIPTGPQIDYSGIQPHILPQRRKLDYLYAQDEWNFAPDWALTSGVCYDRYSDFGGTTNPRFALVWDATLNLTAKLLYGRAFRAPSSNELHGINPVSNGNPNLRPETIRTLEAALVVWQANKDTQLNLSLFRYDMQDIIRPVPNPPPGPGATFQNTGNQQGYGSELELVWDFHRNLRFTGNYSHQRSTDEATETDAGYSPHHHVYARGDWRFASGWLASSQVNYVAERQRAAGDTRPKVPDYTAVDVTLRASMFKHWDFAFSVRNLFDADAREPTLVAPAVAGLPTSLIRNDLPLSGRSFYAQASYRF